MNHNYEYILNIYIVNITKICENFLILYNKQLNILIR